MENKDWYTYRANNRRTGCLEVAKPVKIENKTIDTMVLFMAKTGSEEAFTALDKDGKLIWQRKNRWPKEYGSDMDKNYRYCKHIIAKDRIILGSDTGKVSCFDLEGNKVWENDTGLPNNYNLTSYEGKVIVSSHNHFIEEGSFKRKISIFSLDGKVLNKTGLNNTFTAHLSDPNIQGNFIYLSSDGHTDEGCSGSRGELIKMKLLTLKGEVSQK